MSECVSASSNVSKAHGFWVILDKWAENKINVSKLVLMSLKDAVDMKKTEGAKGSCPSPCWGFPASLRHKRLRGPAAWPVAKATGSQPQFRGAFLKEIESIFTSESLVYLIFFYLKAKVSLKQRVKC